MRYLLFFKEEETNDAEVFEEVVVEMARWPRAPRSLVVGREQKKKN